MRSPTTPDGLWFEVSLVSHEVRGRSVQSLRVHCQPHGKWLGDFRRVEDIEKVIRPFERRHLFAVADVIDLDSRRASRDLHQSGPQPRGRGVGSRRILGRAKRSAGSRSCAVSAAARRLRAGMHPRHRARSASTARAPTADASGVSDSYRTSRRERGEHGAAPVPY